MVGDPPSHEHCREEIEGKVSTARPTPIIAAAKKRWALKRAEAANPKKAAPTRRKAAAKERGGEDRTGKGGKESDGEEDGTRRPAGARACLRLLMSADERSIDFLTTSHDARPHHYTPSR
jgi:hypothetical protein